MGAGTERDGASRPADPRAGVSPLARGGTRDLLESVDFRRFVIVGSLVNAGRWIELVLLGWIVAEFTGSVWLVALAGFYRNAPMLVVSALVGELGDRLGRPRMSLFAEGLAAAVCLALGVILLLGERGFPYLAVGAFGLGLSYAIEFPTRRALIADLVGRSALMSAVSLDIFAFNIMRVVGPLVGGVALKALDPGAGYLLLGALYGCAALLFSTVRFPAHRTATDTRPPGFVEGLRVMRGNATILGIFGVTITMNMLVFPHQQLLPVFARDTLQVDALGLGWLTAATGVGSVIGSGIMARAPNWPQGRTFLLSSISTAVLVVLFAASQSFWVAMGCLIAAGLAQSGFSTMQAATILHAAPPDVRGRATGWLSVMIGFGPLGVLGVGALAGVLGAPLAVAIGAVFAFALLVLQSIAAPTLRAYRWRDD